MVYKLHGIIPPLITPFTKDGQVYEKGIENILEFICDHINGLFLCGSYGSGPLMSAEQRKKVVEICMRYLSRSVKVIVHVGSTDTLTSIALAKHAEDVGADAVASVPPYYYKHSGEAVKEHFKRLLEAVDIPVYVYNNPKTVGYAISPTLLRELEEMGVRGVKDSSFDILNFMNYKRACSSDFDVVVGTEALMLPSYILGARAFIPGLGNHFPEVVRELFDACEKGDWERARNLQYKVLALREITHSAGSSIAGVHAILKLRGVDAGYPRLPFTLPSEDRINEIKRKLVKLGVRLQL